MTLKKLRAKADAAQFLVEERQLGIKMLKSDLKKVQEEQRAQQAEDERGFAVLSRP